MYLPQAQTVVWIVNAGNIRKGLTYIATFAEDVAADMTQQME
jgi:hypothetical protein